MNARRPNNPPLYAYMALVCLGVLLLAACDRVLDDGDDIVIPTRAEITYEDVRTADFFTQNAPPPGFDSVTFPEIDDNLLTTVYSRFEIQATFSGFYADTREEIESSSMNVRVWNDEFNLRRHVQLAFTGEVFSSGSTNLDIVRISNDYYLRDANGACTTDPAQIAEIATIRAGQMVGGVEYAEPTGQKGDVNGLAAWQYGFDPQLINPPALQLEAPTAELDYLRGELWASPEHNVAVRYTVVMNVNQAVLFFGERPVTGRLTYQYDVFDIGVPPNISIPRGC